MVTKSNFWRTVAIALFIVNACVLGFFMSRPHPPRGEGPKKMIAERLHFDASQIAAYDKLIEQHQKDIQAKEKEIKEAKQQLYSLLQGDGFSAKDSLANRIGQLQVEVEFIHFNHFNDLKNLCKDEQLDDFNALAGELAQVFAHPGRNGTPGKQ